MTVRTAEPNGATDGSTSDRSAAPPEAGSLVKRVTFDAVGRRLFGRGSGPVMLGRFVVLGTVGRGGMGTVFKAYDESLDRAIAIKQLHPHTRRSHVERLRREAQALAKLSHPNVVQVYEVGQAEGQWFIAMELVLGTTLREWHEEEHDWRERVSMYLQAGAGLVAAHAVGLVHRDFKPDNCIIDEHGRLRVLDFGLARDSGGSQETLPSHDDAAPPPTGSSAPLTSPGAVLGTHGYMPPEQLAGQPVDARSDQFSFCVSLYEALYGKRPFESTASLATQGRPSVPRGTDVPEAIHEILARGLAHDPDDRWPSMDALLAALRQQAAPRRRRGLALMLMGAVAATGLGLAAYAEVRHRCEGAASSMDGVWDEGRRRAVMAAILGTGLSYADETWERVARRLDEYAGAWVHAHTEVCEATSVRREQSPEMMDLRMACLRRRRVALQKLVDVLTDATETRVEHAVELAANLPGLAQCDDTDALLADLPPPEDAEVAAQVDALRDRLQLAASLRQAGDFDEAFAAADAVVEQAEALQYPPLLAEAILQRGLVHDDNGKYAESQQDLERAYELAAQHGHGTVEVGAAAELVRVAGVRLAHHQEGLWWGKTALALARAEHVEHQVEALVLLNIGSVLREDGKLDEALTRQQESLTIREQALGPEHPDVAKSLLNLGAVLREQGKLDEALAHNRRGLALLEQALGSGHPDVAKALNGVGIVLKRQGKLDEALTALRRALTIMEATLGPEHPSVAAVLNNVGNLLKDQGELDEALACFRRALAIWEQTLGPDHPSVATSRENIGSLLVDQRNLEDALLEFRRALAIREKALGPMHPDIGRSLQNIGVILGKTGQQSEALAHLQRALTIEEAALGPEHPEVVKSVNNIGLVLQYQGRLDEARTYFQRALTGYRQALGPEHPDVARPLRGLAAVALEQGDFDDARVHAERAVALSELEGASPSMLAGTRFLLARALWPEPDQRPRAVELARQAREYYVSFTELEEPRGHANVEKVDAWLAEHRLR